MTYNKHDPISMKILSCSIWITFSQLEARCKMVNKKSTVKYSSLIMQSRKNEKDFARPAA